MTKAQQQLKTINALIEGYNNPTYEALVATRSEDFQHVVRPMSLNRPSNNRLDYVTGVVNSKQVLQDFKVALLFYFSIFFSLFYFYLSESDMIFKLDGSVQYHQRRRGWKSCGPCNGNSRVCR